MESIKLTEVHKVKLLEMCEALFPESYTKTWDVEGLFDYEPIDHKNFQCFHWFEFCMTKLSSTLALNSAKTDILLDVEWESFIDKTNKAVFKGARHPVDYLYEKFSKLKKQPEKTVHKETLDFDKYKIARK